MTEHSFIEIKPADIVGNPFQMIDEEWFLLTAGSAGKFNTMTASWGGVGILWNKAVVFVFVRPQRFTYQFMETNELFSLSFFEESERKALNFCGKYSGRDKDKVAATGLIPAETADGAIYFTQARLFIQCRKIYYGDLDPAHFLMPSIQKNYPKNDYHRMYIGEIEKCFSKQEK